MRKDWLETTLGDSCTFYNGKAHEKQIDENGDFIVVNSKFISSDGITAKRTISALFPLRKNDIVMVMSDVPNGRALAKCYLVEEDNKYSLNQRICVIRSKMFDTKFLYYHLNRHPYLLGFDNGENQTNLRKDDILKCPLYVPPLPEQKRIVAIADQAFEGIDRAIANTEKNLTNARELFERYLSIIFTQKGDGWVEKTVGEIADHSLGKMLDKEKNKGVFKPYLRNFNVRWFEFDLSDLLKMRFEESEWEKYTAVKGDILICEGGYPGRAAIWQEDEPIFFQKAIHRVRFKDFTHSKWFLYFIYLADCNGELKKYFTGAGIQHFTGQSLHRFKLPIPPLSVIEKFVEQFDELRLETQRLEAIYQRKLAALNELKQSILQKAFTGELTADTTQQATEAVKEVVAA